MSEVMDFGFSTATNGISEGIEQIPVVTDGDENEAGKTTVEQTPQATLKVQEALQLLDPKLKEDRKGLEDVKRQLAAEGKGEQKIQQTIEPMVMELAHKQLAIYEQYLRDEGRLAEGQQLSVKELKDYISGLLLSENPEDQALILGSTGFTEDTEQNRIDARAQVGSALSILLSNEGMTLEDLFRLPVQEQNQPTINGLEVSVEKQGMSKEEKARKVWNALMEFDAESEKVGDKIPFEEIMNLIFYNEFRFRSIYGDSHDHITEHGLEHDVEGTSDSKTLKLFEEAFSTPEKKKTFLESFTHEMSQHSENVGEASYDQLFDYFTKVGLEPDEHVREKKLHVIKEAIHKAAESAHLEAVHTMNWQEISLGKKSMAGFFLYLRRSG